MFAFAAEVALTTLEIIMSIVRSVFCLHSFPLVQQLVQTTTTKNLSETSSSISLHFSFVTKGYSGQALSTNRWFINKHHCNTKRNKNIKFTFLFQIANFFHTFINVR